MRKHGKIKSHRPEMVVAANVVAARVAEMISPDNAGDIFSRLKERLGGKFNAHSRMPLNSGFKSTGSVNETINNALRNQLPLETRDQMSTRTGMGLANLAYAPRSGVGTAAQTKPRTGEQEQAGFGDYQTYGTYGNQQQQTSDPRMVDDEGWSKTLAQTVGSGMISAAQFQAASFANVQAMIGQRTSPWTNKDTGGVATPGTLSADEKTEMTYMFQRMILEGYVRGVDIPAMVKKMPGGQMKLSTSNSPALGYGVAGYGYGAMFDKNWWATASDIDKIGLFYQEVGHAMGEADHTRGLMKGTDSIFSADDQAKKMYSQYLDYYFEDVKNDSSYVEVASHTGALDAAGAQKLIDSNKSWFPSITGVVGDAKTETKTVSSYGAPMTGAKSSLDMEPSTIDMLAPTIGGGQQEQGAASLATPSSELSESVVAPTRTFAEGMADISKPNPPAESGALLK